MDVRVLLPPNFSGDNRLLKAEPDTLKIDWAFAGTAASSDGAHAYETLNPGRTCIWTHWIDTHKPFGYQEMGSMYKQADGTILEIGMMESPATGMKMEYHEVWEDPVPQIIHRGSGKAVSHAIELAKERSKGTIIRVGDWIQGLRIDGEGKDKKVTVERWHWHETEDPKGEWKIMFKIGEGELPCWYVIDEDDVGKEWPEGAEKWRLIEHELFKPA